MKKYEIICTPTIDEGIRLYRMKKFEEAASAFAQSESGDATTNLFAKILEALTLIKSGSAKKGRRLLFLVVRNKGMWIKIGKYSFRGLNLVWNLALVLGGAKDPDSLVESIANTFSDLDGDIA